MIETILNIIKMFLAILPFLILCIVSCKVNLPKTERSKQFPMPVIALVYVFVTMLLMDHINDWLIKLIENIPKWIASLGAFTWMPAQIGSVFTQIASTIRSALAELNLHFWIFFISNTVMILVYLFVKKTL